MADPQYPAPPIFVLVGYNRAGKLVVNEQANIHLRYTLENDLKGLYISFGNPDKQVFTLGRDNNADILLPDPKSNLDLSRHQCSFYNYVDHHAVFLEDYSRANNTQPISANNGRDGGVVIPFGRGRRTVLVARGINSLISIGKDQHYQFEIYWLSDGLHDFGDSPYVVGPRKSRNKKYLQGDKVGGGTYGTVFKALNVHTGELMAVKKFHNLEGKNLDFATREVANLFRINKSTSIHHNNILEILDYEKDDDWGEIFMPLKHGNLKTLVENNPDLDCQGLADMVLVQMLSALKCIAQHKIVHRDLKPENILWEYDAEGNYHFRLGDFGLSNNPELAVTIAGTEPFMAPEVQRRRKQTDRVDIWSLFATIVWIRNINGFRANCARVSADDVHRWLVGISRMEEFTHIRLMASMNPKERPSAKELLRIVTTNPGGDGTASVGDDLAESLQQVSLNPGWADDEDDEDDPLAGAGPNSMPSGMDTDTQGAAASGALDPFHVPYYEPYPPAEYNFGNDEDQGYQPPPHGEQPRRNPEAWVAPYGEVYGPPDESSPDPNSGTAVPEFRTARQMPNTQEIADIQAQVPPEGSRHRKGQGKKRGGAR